VSEAIPQIAVAVYLWVAGIAWLAWFSAMGNKEHRPLYPLFQLEKNALLWLPILIASILFIVYALIAPLVIGLYRGLSFVGAKVYKFISTGWEI